MKNQIKKQLKKKEFIKIDKNELKLLRELAKRYQEEHKYDYLKERW